MLENENMINILFAEDDANLSMILTDYLEMVGYSVDHAPDGEECVKLFKENNYQLVILDVMMPIKDGFTTAKEIREINQLVPIVFLTAKNLKEDRIKGFQFGCDDYISKPFSTEELSLRIKAILKRCTVIDQLSNEPFNESITIGKFVFDSSNMTLKFENSERSLTRKEAGLLKLLCVNINNLVPREVAMVTIWGENDYFIGRSMDVFIAKLRKYLKPDPNVKINNIHGIGFKLEVLDSD
ncbi:MAG TPA: response regulator transcription factor [Bacteroidales bacterium]|jgi:DNA-binding response OmpR family regulator|nr:response regulator transcription factor [Bacteroidales bacterium]|tara:strand:+ start:769 stop:1488 length:720 start_codon:yes stop_codon:yes gene_type:complete